MRKAIIMGAAGRDFHNFNMLFKNNPDYKVICFTAAQIPNISGRTYPPKLAGRLYPKGIKIYPEEKISDIIKTHNIDDVFFSYSDVSNQEIMRKACLVSSFGANFIIPSPLKTMLRSRKPVISVCAVRTGAGKSPTTRKICRILKDLGKTPVVVRHPMPYGDLEKKICEQFKTIEDLKGLTLEEIEDYEHHIREGVTVFSGIDYSLVLKKAERCGDVIVWDGGNNDLPFVKPDLHIVIADPHRPGHELRYYHGTLNVMMADVVIINKINTAGKTLVKKVERNVKKINPKATIIKTRCRLSVSDPQKIRDKRVVIVEDGPTLTHGGMSVGAGYHAVKNLAEIVDPRPYAVGSIKKVYR
ncbi:MAG: GTPase, partial [Candidatus Aenigmatarchaeota archaeon]